MLRLTEMQKRIYKDNQNLRLLGSEPVILMSTELLIISIQSIQSKVHASHFIIYSGIAHIKFSIHENNSCITGMTIAAE